MAPECRSSEEPKWKPNSPAPTNRVRESCGQPILRSQPRRIGLGHPLGRDPARTIDSYSGRWYWLLADAIQPCWQASLMAS